MNKIKSRSIFFLVILLTPLIFDVISTLHYCVDKYEFSEESSKIKFFESDKDYTFQIEADLPVLNTKTFNYHFFHEPFLEIFREVVTPPPEFL